MYTNGRLSSAPMSLKLSTKLLPAGMVSGRASLHRYSQGPTGLSLGEGPQVAPAGKALHMPG